MDIVGFIKFLIIVSVIKGVIGFLIYWWLAHKIRKDIAAVIIFLLYTIVPWLTVVYSGGEIIEKLGRQAAWGAEGIIGVIVGGALVWLYEHLTGKTRERIY